MAKKPKKMYLHTVTVEIYTNWNDDTYFRNAVKEGLTNRLLNGDPRNSAVVSVGQIKTLTKEQ